MRCLLLALASLLLITTGSVTVATAGQATCSNPGLPVGAGASSDLLPGQLSWTLTTGFLPITSEETLQEPRGDVTYDSRLVLVETRVAAEYAVTPWLALGVALPYRVVDVDVTYRDPQTGEVLPPLDESTIHSRTERISGLGDPTLLAHAAREVGAYRFHVRVGTSLPLGGTEEDPFALGNIGMEHEHVQLGTGTFMPLAAFEVQRSFGKVSASAWTLVQPSLYENGNGYRAGHRLSGGLGASTGFGLRRWSFSAAAEAHAEGAERWNGKVYKDEGNAGRVDVLTGLAVSFRPTKHLAIIADAKVPAYQHYVGVQLGYSIVAGFGIAGSFDLASRPTWRGVDQQVVGPAGSAPAIEPVKGRITVLDLWADWCPPCRELETKLEALAKRHPDRIAVRRLDVVDTESDAWTKYLAPGKFELPHVKVYGADGNLLFEKSAPPDELVRAVEAALQ